MKLVDKPQFLPGHCLICRSGNRAQFIDPQVALEFEGHVYICDKCVIDMANMLTYVPQTKIPDGYLGLVTESSDTIKRFAGEFSSKLGASVDNLSVIATSLADMAEQQKSFIERRLAQYDSEGAQQASIGAEGPDQLPDPGTGGEKLGAGNGKRKGAAPNFDY